VIGEGCVLDKVICAENSVIGNGTVLGEGEDIPNDTRPDIYCAGLVTVGENTVIPEGVHIGKNVMISGHTTEADYPGGWLASGSTLQVAAQ
jgi:glucose-1-phosphate adenylyltransferase